MKLSETRYDNLETGCCARLDPARWDGQTLNWRGRRFLRARVRALFHIPVNFGAVMRRVHASVESAEAYPVEPFWLSDEVSPWSSDLYVAVDRSVPGGDTVTLDGTFLTRVFEGSFRHVGDWIKAMQAHVESQGRTTRKIYFFYATCPKCAKHFGQNQVVLFAQVD
ncbi:MAG TPA: hydrolase [Longimicrobiales bacterium]|nr:hydrolase [Longimicrobiales bacterium]